MINDMLDSGVNPPKHEKKQAGPLTGKTIVVTGTLEKFTRQSIKQAIKEEGGKVSSSISKKTDFLLAGENAGSKLEKANKLAVKVITEEDFLAMIRIST